MAIGGRFMRRFMGTRSVRPDCSLRTRHFMGRGVFGRSAFLRARPDCFCARDILQGCVFCRHCQAADIGRGRLPEAGIQD